jgi:hypothetical protein
MGIGDFKNASLKKNGAERMGDFKKGQQGMASNNS